MPTASQASSSSTMPSCSICLEALRSPVSVPCGHIFCSECLIRAINAVNAFTTLHQCPICRSSYFCANIDSALVPPHLRPHLMPSIRKVYLGESSTTSRIPSSERDREIECARMKAENDALRSNIVLWRKRAEVHAGATLGLLGLTRAARDHANKVTRERDELQRQLSTLKRKVYDDDPLLNVMSPHSSPVNAQPMGTSISLQTGNIRHIPIATIPQYTPCYTSCHVNSETDANLKIGHGERPFKRRRDESQLGDSKRRDGDCVIPEHSFIRRRSAR